jgi:hypothetical protein
MVRLEFLTSGIGQGPITIEGPNLGGSDASALLNMNNDPILAIRWYSGTLSGE